MPNTMHPGESEFAWYLTSGLSTALRSWPSQRSDTFEQHVSDCDQCADRLTSLAQEELLMEELALEPIKPRRSTTWIGGAIAVAAIFFFTVVGGASSTPASQRDVPAVMPAMDAGVVMVADGDVYDSDSSPLLASPFYLVMVAFSHKERLWWCVLIALIAGVVYLPGLGAFGFWDPQEISVVERSLENPTGLTTWSVRLGIEIFGSGEFGARLPMASLGIVAAVLTFLWGTHAANRRVGLLAALFVMAAPLVLFQSRQVTSSVGAMVGQLMMVAGVTGMLCREPVRVVLCVACSCVGALAAYSSAGALLGVLVPLVALGVAAAATKRFRVAALLASLALVVATLCIAGVLSAGESWRAEPRTMGWDVALEHVAFGAFPWIVLAPMALAHVVETEDPKRRFAGWLAFSWTLLAWVATTLLTLKSGPVTFPALPALAFAVAVWSDDVYTAQHRPAIGARVFAVVAVIVLARDLVVSSERLASVHLATSLRAVSIDGWLAALPLVMGIVFAALVVVSTATRDRWRRLGGPATVGSCLVFACLLSFCWTPAISRHRSNKDLFDQYASLHNPGNVLAVLGTGQRAAALYGIATQTMRNNSELARLLGGEGRVFALVPQSGVCALTQSARASNIATFVMAENDSFALVSNRHRSGEPRAPGLEQVIGSEPPARPTNLLASFDGEIELVGVELPERVRRGDSFAVTLYYRVRKKPRRKWKVFVHFDGPGSRFQGDHWPIDDRCSTSQWNVGDYIVDTFSVSTPGTTGARGRFRVWSGFFVGSHGNWTNMPVASGRADEANRVAIGEIEIY